MTQCSLCRKDIQPGTSAVSIAGGLFPREDPDFFMIDATVLQESYTHLECLLKIVKESSLEVS